MRLQDRTLRVAAWASLLLCAMAFVVAFVLLAVDPEVSGRFAFNDSVDPVVAVVVLLFPTVGLFIVQQQPRNRVGWLLHACAWPWALAALVDAYSRIALHIAPGSLPASDAVQVVGSELWWPGILLMGVFLPLFFPDGSLPSPRWRWLAWVCGVAGVIGIVLFSMAGGEPPVMLEPVDSNPFDVGLSAVAVSVIVYTLVPIAPLGVLAASASVIARFRHASGVQRLQLKWLLAAVAFVAGSYAFAMMLGVLGVDDGPFADLVGNAVFAGFGLIPITIGIAITRHGLYDIDRLISRSLMVGALGVFITVVYVGIVVGLGRAIGERQPSVWLSVIATALVAVAFQPVRERLQRGVNRLVYGTRATPYDVLSEFAAGMAGHYSTADLLPRLAQTLSQCLGGAQVHLWLRRGERLTRQASWPRGEASQEPEGDRIVPVRHHDELLGLVTVTKPAGEPVTPAEDEMLAHVASQASLVMRNRRLVEDLQASRERLVTSADRARRRLERNLHDGAQQSLVSVALMLRMAGNGNDPGTLSASVHEAADQLQQAIAELRELARGIHPAILTDRGLGPAISSLAERSPVPVIVDNTVERRLPAALEATMYFVAAEALTNTAKYAEATRVSLRLRDLEDAALLEVSDDGVGGAATDGGTGLLGLADRVAVVGGTFEVHSPVGTGTTLRCQVPVATPTAVVVPEHRPPSGAVAVGVSL